MENPHSANCQTPSILLGSSCLRLSEHSHNSTTTLSAAGMVDKVSRWELSIQRKQYTHQLLFHCVSISWITFPVQLYIQCYCVCLSKRDNLSRCIYLHQVLYIYVKIRLYISRFAYTKTRFQYTYQDLHTRIKIRLRVHQV